MSNIVYARSGRQWDYLYMKSLGLDFIDSFNYKDFFEEELPNVFDRQDVINELLNYDLNNPQINDNTSDTIVDFIKNVIAVVKSNQNEESTVDDLGKKLFNIVGFNRNMKLNIHGPTKMKYLMSGQTIEANPDIVVQNDNNKYFLIIQEDKSYKNTEDNNYDEAEPQLVAELIGAFYNNYGKSRGTLNSQVLYGIVMLGTHCTFYKFHINSNILERLVNGEKCNTIMNYIERFTIGNKDPNFILNQNNLIYTLKCYESLKHIIFKSL